MFIGEYRHNLDNKGRITIPSKFRQGLKSGFVLTRGLDNCLFLYPMEEWNLLKSKLKKLPLTNKNARAFVRFFLSGASEGNLDKQGRALIPVNLREYIKIQKEGVILGLSSRIEIWSKEEWEEYNSLDTLSYEEIAEQMTDLGI